MPISPQAHLESEKIRTFSVSPTLYAKYEEIQVWHGLRITKRPAVWLFSIFLFEKYQFLLENILSLFRMLKRF